MKTYRTIPPVEFKFSKINFPIPELREFSSGLKIHSYNTPGSRAFKIEFILRNANSFRESHSGINLLISKLFLSGTKTKNASTIAELLAQKGAFVEISPSFDYTSITLLCLKKNVIDSLQLISEVLSEIHFANDEIELQKSILNSNYKVQQKKNTVVASQKFRQILYSHPYGTTPTPDSWTPITSNDLVNQFNSYWKNYEIISIGDHDPLIFDFIDKTFKPNTTTYNNLKFDLINPDSAVNEHIKIKDSIQTTIKIGKFGINKHHDDYSTFLMSNYILGGFFGSRLMKNIREEKGLTYGIYSSIVHLNHSSYFIISSDVEAGKKKLAINEILKELDNLINEPLLENELIVAKNHWLGSFQNDLSSSLTLNDKFKSFYLFDLPSTFYNTLISKINDLTVNDIQITAKKYLQPTSMNILQVGG